MTVDRFSTLLGTSLARHQQGVDMISVVVDPQSDMEAVQAFSQQGIVPFRLSQQWP
jgi:hypothetical protein